MANVFEGFAVAAGFPKTSWTLIVNARDPETAVSRQALGTLCRNYWYPVFAFLCRKGLDAEQARDCTQDFFAALIEKDYLADLEQSKGKFRSFLLASASHFLLNRLDGARALKRGGGCQILTLEQEDIDSAPRNVPAHFLTPEAVFEYHWAESLLEGTMTRLRAFYPAHQFEILKPFLLGEAARGEGAAAAAQLGISDNAFKVAVHRLRKHYREVLRAEIAETVADPGQVDEEIRYLLRVLGQTDRKAL
jgi:RNA polymerase sigma-70 factor (ECF subfamily)